jgi:hydrogenase maturation protease
MNCALVNKIVNAVLYEGYMLYPYRPSVKNQHRWTFGGLYPRSYSDAQAGNDRWAIQTECLVRATERTAIEVEVRFLHLQTRQIGELEPPQKELKDGDEPAFRPVEVLRVGQRFLQTWQEAVEREVPLGELGLGSLLAARRHLFAFPGLRQLEPVRGSSDEVAGLIVRDQQSIAGMVEVYAAPVAEGLFKLRVRIENQTPLEYIDQLGRDEVLLRSLVSTHTILGVCEGEFVSLVDPPEEWRALAAGCQNEGTWPVLVGEEGEKDTMLSSPIILYDYPEVAPESPGDLFDCTEIDEILTLRILTLTEEEKQAAAAVDDRVRALLERSEALAREQLLGLHGTVRGLRLLSGGGLP